MSKNQARKNAARAYAKKHGVSYTAALRAVSRSSKIVIPLGPDIDGVHGEWEVGPHSNMLVHGEPGTGRLGTVAAAIDAASSNDMSTYVIASTNSTAKQLHDRLPTDVILTTSSLVKDVFVEIALAGREGETLIVIEDGDTFNIDEDRPAQAALSMLLERPNVHFLISGQHVFPPAVFPGPFWAHETGPARGPDGSVAVLDRTRITPEERYGVPDETLPWDHVQKVDQAESVETDSLPLIGPSLEALRIMIVMSTLEACAQESALLGTAARQWFATDINLTGSHRPTAAELAAALAVSTDVAAALIIAIRAVANRIVSGY
jgi:hypothetical protein